MEDAQPNGMSNTQDSFPLFPPKSGHLWGESSICLLMAHFYTTPKGRILKQVPEESIYTQRKH